MFNRIIRYRFWISGGIIFFLGIWFLGAMLKTAGITKSDFEEKSLLQKAKDNYYNAKYIKAADSYEKLLILEPENKNATLSLAVIYDDYIGRKDRAIELYKDYLSMQPNTNKKEYIEKWIVDAAQSSLGIEKIGNENYENKISELNREIDDINKKNEKLVKEIEELSGKLYIIQAEYEKEIQSLQEQRDLLSSQITGEKIRISELTRKLQDKEKETKILEEELEELKTNMKRGILR